jgi:hypothetical protein
MLIAIFKVMKKIPALLLVAILLLNTAGFYVYYVIALHRLHAEMRLKIKTIPDDQLSRLVLTHEQFKTSLIDEHEMKLDGQMFDIARTIIFQDSIVVFALHDVNEENFLACANEIISRPVDRDSPVTTSAVQFICLDFLQVDCIKKLFCDHDIIVHASVYSTHFNTWSSEDVEPPPRSC